MNAELKIEVRFHRKITNVETSNCSKIIIWKFSNVLYFDVRMFGYYNTNLCIYTYIFVCIFKRYLYIMWPWFLIYKTNLSRLDINFHDMYTNFFQLYRKPSSSLLHSSFQKIIIPSFLIIARVISICCLGLHLIFFLQSKIDRLG